MSLRPIPFGPGFAPDVTVYKGLVYLAFGTTAGLELVVLTPDGLEVHREQLADGFFDSFPRFDGPWLVYRQNEAYGFTAAALHLETGLSLTFGPAGGTYSLAVNAALGIVAFEQQRPDRSWAVWFGSLTNGQFAETPIPGAPDGLDRVLSATAVSLRNQTRTSVPGIVYPVVAGSLTVGERPDSGIAVLLAGEPLRVLLSGSCMDPRAATDEQTVAIACWGDPGGVRLVLANRSELATLPVPATPTPTVVRLNRPALIGTFDFAGERVPFGGCHLDVRDGLVRATDGSTLLRYIAGSSDSDLGALNAAIAAAPQDIPIVAYWTHQAQASGLPTGARYIGIECYWLVSETRAAFQARMQRAVDQVVAAGLQVVYIAQGYTSNAGNVADLVGVLSALSEVIASHTLVQPIVLVFSGAGRPTGLTDHQYALAAWMDYSGSARAGVVIHHQPAPVPSPKPPAPTPVPVPVPAPVPSTPFPAASPLKGSAMKVYLKKAGKYVGVDPSAPSVVYANRDSAGSWEEVELEPQGDRFRATFTASGLVLSIQPDGALQTRPGGTSGAFELLNATSQPQPDPVNLLYRVLDDGTPVGLLTIEEVQS